MKQSRWKSKVLWSAVAAQALILLQAFGVLNKLGIDAGQYNTVVNGVLGILVLAGVINDPTNREGM